MPKVSVIIAVFNGARTIAKSIQSAQIQTLHDIEILVVDDGSQDNTCDVVNALAQQDARIRLIRQSVNAGPAAARNVAIENAVGDWIAILDADDWMEPDRLEAMVAAGEASHADIVGDNMEIFDHALNRIVDETDFCSSRKTTVLDIEQLFRLDNPLRRHSIGYVQPLIKRAFLSAHAIKYDVSHRVGEDFLFLADIMMKSGKFIIIPGAYYVYRHTFSPTTRKKSAQSHTEDRYDLIIRGCDELMTKYGTIMPAPARKALLRRRAIFKNRVVLKKTVASLREGRYVDTVSGVLKHPAILVHITAAVSKLVYANILGRIRHHLGTNLYVPSLEADDVDIGTPAGPKVSVVIAVLNGMKTIARAIESAQYQTERNIEILVVDDGSTDGTPDFVNSLAAKDKRIKLIKLEKNVGAAAATNIAIEKAEGTWIAILDADDWFEPERIEVMLREAHANNADVVCDNLRIYDHALGRVINLTNFSGSRRPVLLTARYFFWQDNPIRRTAIGYMKPVMKKQFLRDHNITYGNHRVGYDFLLLAEILLNRGRAVIVPGAYYDYVHMFSPTTRKKSPYSHTKNSYDQIITGCDELLEKYSKLMAPSERRALLCRRYMFQSRLHCNDMVAAWRDGHFIKALGILTEWPFIAVILVSAILKWIYANLLNTLWRLKLYRV